MPVLGKIRPNDKGLEKLQSYAQWHKNNPSKYERKFNNILEKIGSTKHSWQEIFYNGSVQRIADFYFPDGKVVVEIDGSQHYTKKGIKSDIRRGNLLKRYFGVKEIIHIPNNEVDEGYVWACLCRNLIHSQKYGGLYITYLIHRYMDYSCYNWIYKDKSLSREEIDEFEQIMYSLVVCLNRISEKTLDYFSYEKIADRYFNEN